MGLFNWFGKSQKVEEASVKSENFDHHVMQFSSGADIIFKANELVEKMSASGTKSRLNPKYIGNKNHQVVEIKNAQNKWIILAEFVKS